MDTPCCLCLFWFWLNNQKLSKVSMLTPCGLCKKLAWVLWLVLEVYQIFTNSLSIQYDQKWHFWLKCGFRKKSFIINIINLDSCHLISFSNIINLSVTFKPSFLLEKKPCKLTVWALGGKTASHLALLWKWRKIFTSQDELSSSSSQTSQLQTLIVVSYMWIVPLFIIGRRFLITVFPHIVFALE